VFQVVNLSHNSTDLSYSVCVFSQMYYHFQLEVTFIVFVGLENVFLSKYITSRNVEKCFSHNADYAKQGMLLLGRTTVTESGMYEFSCNTADY